MKQHPKAKETSMTNQTIFNPDRPQLNTISDDDFYKTYYKYMYKVARSEKLNHYDAEDIVNYLMIGLLVEKNYTNRPKRRSFLRYLATMVQKEARYLYGKEQRYQYYDNHDMEQLFNDNGMYSFMK